jgi:hypothetical protein
LLKEFLEINLLIYFSSPRLDLTSETPARYASSEEVAPQRRQQRHARHENHRFSNFHKHNSNISSHIALLRNKAHRLRNSDLLHRDDNVGEENQ